jgi:peptidoglycan hydrolase-like protein with peptidoglycan-binding domain
LSEIVNRTIEAYPALGYDPNYSYDYNGPIYTYGNLLPDQIIANVQTQLQQDGYYSGAINGSLDAATHARLRTISAIRVWS